MTHEKILVVDDDQGMGKYVSFVLGRHGYCVAEVVSAGLEAVRSAEALRPDLILMDVNLGGEIDGIEAARRVRHSLDIPVIFMTGDNDEETLERSKTADPLGYLLKPFKGKDLHAVIETALNQFRSSRARTEEAVGTSESFYQSLVQSLPQNIVRKDLQGRFTFVNQNFCKSVHKTEEEIIGKTDFDLFPKGLAMKYVEDDRQVTLSGSSRTIIESHVNPNGGKIQLEVIKSPLFNYAREIVGTQCIFWDVTERENDKEAVLESERRYRELYNEALVGYFELDREARIVRANHTGARMLGFNTEEMIGKQHYDLFFPDDRDAAAQLSKDFIAGKPLAEPHEGRMLCKDGSSIDVTVRMRLKCGASGEILGARSMVQDITKENLALRERALMEVQLRQAQKLEAVGQLAAGVAHEINTPIQYIGDNSRFLKDAFKDLQKTLDAYDRLFDACKNGPGPRVPLEDISRVKAETELSYLSEEIPKAIDQSLEGVERVARIVRAMKEFSHPGTQQRQSVDIQKAIESTLIVSRNEWKYVADAVTEFDPMMPPVPCQPGEINQVILNLIVNAAHAIADAIDAESGEKGRIVISTRKDGDWVEIRVADSGTGIPEQVRSRIFDPFFTTKEVGKGTGQGLAICHAVVVKKHSGTIDFETEIGEGTTFIVRLPLIGGPEE